MLHTLGIISVNINNPNRSPAKVNTTIFENPVDSGELRRFDIERSNLPSSINTFSLNHTTNTVIANPPNFSVVDQFYDISKDTQLSNITMLNVANTRNIVDSNNAIPIPIVNEYYNITRSSTDSDINGINLT